MCIIIAKPQGAEMPPMTTLRWCAYMNPHGFGFATADRTFKTLSADRFMDALSKLDPEDAVIIHFRYATHGSIKRANCHPFRDEESGVAFAHNGILNIIPKDDMTDSETAFRGLIAPAIHNHGYWSSEFDREVNGIIGGSRFAFIDKDAQIRIFGHFTEHNRCYYSNKNFIPYKLY